MNLRILNGNEPGIVTETELADIADAFLFVKSLVVLVDEPFSPVIPLVADKVVIVIVDLETGRITSTFFIFLSFLQR